MAKNTQAQQIAKKAMEALYDFIRPGVTQREITIFAEEKMLALGATSWWHHGYSGTVLVGEKTVQSISVKSHIPSEEIKVRQTDIITADLTPTLDGQWGDIARTIVIENGIVRGTTDEINTPEFREGIEMEKELHRLFCLKVHPDMTYEETYFLMNDYIEEMGYVNLDFKGNLGHSVEIDQADRIYFEKGNTKTIREHGKPVTFEPHIKKRGGNYGFKREDMYEIEKSHLSVI